VASAEASRSGIEQTVDTNAQKSEKRLQEDGMRMSDRKMFAKKGLNQRPLAEEGMRGESVDNELCFL
jgi:hypothetical protein